MSIRKLTLTGLATFAALAGGILATSAPALAKELYLPDYSFGSEGPGASTFSTIQALAVEQSSGDVYVYDALAGSLSKFNSAGEPVEFTALHTNVIESIGNSFVGASEGELAIDESSGPADGDIYVAVDSRVAIYRSDGSSLGELNEHVTTEVPGATWSNGCGVSVDRSGHVYVGEFSSVNEYTPTANPVTNTDYVSTLEGFFALCNVVADGDGNVYGQSAFGRNTRRYPVSQFGSVGGPPGAVIDPAGRAMTLDPATNNLFVDEESGNIAQFDPAGNLVRRFATLGGESFGVGVNSASHEVYVADTSSGQVDAFKLVDVPLPAVNDQTPVASAVTRTKAALAGVVDPKGYATHYKFVYGPTSSYVHSTAELNAGAGSGDLPVGPVGLEGLTPGTTYHYALVATNPAGTSTGSDQTFTTAAATPPVVATGAPSGVGQSSVTLTGTVDDRGLAGTYGFEIGTSAGAYGPRIGLGLIKTGAGAAAAALNVVSLEPGTTYHYRVTAMNADGTSYGVDQSFTTGLLASAAVQTPLAPGFLKIPTVVFPKEAGATTTKSSTSAQKLAKALKACKRKAKSKRAACERQARKKYPTARSKTKRK